MRQINLKQFRPLKYDPYINNLISSPTDGRVYGFNIEKTTNFKINNDKYHFRNLVTKPYELLNGSGFINRLTFSDYQRIYIPYSGFLKEIGIHNLDSKQYCISLRFESTYFMPPSVHEREYVSVIYGHATQMAPIYPELMDVQPKIN